MCETPTLEELAEAMAEVMTERDALREENSALRSSSGRLSRDVVAWQDENAALRARVGELEGENVRQFVRLRAADALVKAFDAAVAGGHLDSRTPIADARLDYGDPFKYTDDALRAQLADAEGVIEAKNASLRAIMVQMAGDHYSHQACDDIMDNLQGALDLTPAKEPRDG